MAVEVAPFAQRMVIATRREAPPPFACRLLKTRVENPRPLGQNVGMATLSLTDEQVVQLVRQLPPQSKQRLLVDLSSERDTWWQAAAGAGERDLRRLATARGLDWDALSETQRETLVDDLLHES